MTVYLAATPPSYSTKLYPGSGRSFRKGGSSFRKILRDRDQNSSSYRKILRDRDQNRSTPSATFTKLSKSGSGQATMTVNVPRDSNKCKVQSNEGASHSKCQRRSGKPKGDQKE